MLLTRVALAAHRQSANVDVSADVTAGRLSSEVSLVVFGLLALLLFKSHSANNSYTYTPQPTSIALHILHDVIC